MAIPNLKFKLKQNLKNDIEKEETAGGRKVDKRFVNYFDLKFEERMTVLFVPDENGAFWAKYSTHGPNLKYKAEDGKDRAVRGVEHINCIRTATGQECPICQKGFDLYAQAKETTDAGKKQALRNEARKWMPRDYTLMSLVVIEAPMEITASDDDNQVKLFSLPFAVEKIIREAIKEEQIAEDELCSTPFIIKKTKNQGGKAAYDASYFRRKMVEDDEVAYLEDLKVEQFDYLTLDVIPEQGTEEDMVNWLDKATTEYAKVSGNVAGGSQQTTNTGNTEDDDNDNRRESRKTSSVSALERAKQAALASKQEEDDKPAQEPEEEPEPTPEPETKSEKEEPEEESKSNAVRNRLSGLRRR